MVNHSYLQPAMAIHKNTDSNAFVRFVRKIYNPIGFQKGYNFILFFIFAGALLGFGLARAEYLNVQGVFFKSGGPGEGESLG